MTTTNVGIKLTLDGAAQAEAGLRRVERGIEGLGGAASTVRGALSGLTAAFAGAVSVRAFLQAADAVTQLQNQLRLATGSTQAATQAYQQLFEIAQRSRVSFTELGGTFATIARATESLGLSQQQLLGITETIGNAITVSGASATASQAALTQLGQGLASGALRGEELNSILEQTPRLARALADGLGVPIGKLRELGQAGELTAEKVIGALQSQSKVLASEVQNSVVTVGQAFTQVQNSATTLAGEIDRVTGSSGQLAAELQAVGDSLGTIARAFREVGDAEKPVSFFGDAIAVVFETVAVLGANVAFVLKQIRNEIGGLAAQAVAVASGQLTQAKEIGRLMREDAAKARAEVDALSSRILNSRRLAEVARTSLKGVDTRAEDARLARYAEASDRALRTVATGAGTAKKAADEFAKSVERGAKLYGDLTAQDGGLSANFAEQWQDLANAFKAGKVNLEELTAAQAALLAQQPFAKDLAKEQKDAMEAQAKAAEALAKAELERIEAAERSAESAQEQLQRLLDEERAIVVAAEKNISLAQAIEEVAIARLRERQAAMMAEGDRDEEVLALQKEIDARKQLVQAIGRKETREATEQSAKDAAREWERTAENIEKSLTDALLRGFESGKDFARNLRDTVVNMFKTLVLRPVIQAVVSPVAGALTGMLGVPGAANAGQLGNSLGLASGIKSVYDTIMGGFSALGDKVAFAAQDIGAWLVNNTTGVLNQAGGSLMSGAGSLGTAASYLGGITAGLGLGGMISGQYSAFGNANVSNVAGTAIGAFFGGPIGAAIGGAIGGLVNRAFGRGPMQTTGTGITGTFSTEGASVQNYQEWFQKGGWFRSDKAGVNYSAVSSELDQFLDQSLRQVTAASKMYASVLGLNADAVNGITQSIKISLLGLNAEQQQEAIIKALSGFGDVLASAYANPFKRANETAGEALARLANSLVTVNRVFDTLNQTLLESTLVAGDAASQLLDVFGGSEAFVQATSAYYQAFYSEAERADVATRQLTAALENMGLSLPETRAQFRDLVEAQDLTTTAGRNTYAALLRLAPTFAEITAAADDLTASLGAVVAAAVNDSLLLVDQQIKQSQAAAADARKSSADYFAAAKQLRDASESLLLGIGNVAANFEQAYQQTLASARAGDIAALEDLPGRAVDFLTEARKNSRSGAEFSLTSARVAAELATAAQVGEALGANKSYQEKLFNVNTAILEVLREDLKTGSVTAERLAEQITALQTIGALIDGSVAVQTDALSVSEIAAIATRDNARLLSEVTARLGSLASPTDGLWSERLVTGNSLIVNRLDLVVAAINKQTLAAQEEMRRQQNLAAAQRNLEAYAQYAASQRPDALVAMAPTTMLPGQSNDSLWNAIVQRNWDAHVARFGIGWDTWRTTDAERAGALRVMQEQWANERWSQVSGTINAELERQREAVRALGGVPAFAMGGMHSGGVRLVGERGPEIEVTGPARYWSFEQTQQLMSGTRTDESAAELRALREENRAQARAMVQLQQRFTKLLERWDAQGMPEVRVEA